MTIYIKEGDECPVDIIFYNLHFVQICTFFRPYLYIIIINKYNNIWAYNV